MASSSPGARSWRTAFLTLRDETLAPPPPHALLSLLRDLVLSHPSGALAAAAAAAADLPPHEVTSDVMLLAELALAVSKCPDADGALISILHLIHDISCRVHLEVNSSWIMLLNFLEEVLDCVHGSAYRKSFSSRTASVNALTECLAILRLIVKAYGRTNLSIESSQLVRILISIISCLHGELLNSYQSNGADISPRDTGTRSMRYNSLWEMQTLALSMVGDILSWTDSSLSANLWQSIVEVLRKVMDFLASKNLFIENNDMSRFYATLLHCLHLVLSEPKGSLSGHVAGFVATLQMFFMYGLPSRSSIPPAATDLKEKVGGSQDLRSGPSRRNDHGTYRPPHLRKREETRTNSMDLQSSSDCESSRYDFTSSDSDHSDSDGYAKIGDRFRSSKARLAAISCIQDLCHADPKLLTSLWSLLLPEKDVLEPRKYQATLMTSLIFDPVMKIRIEAASTIAAMVEGHAVVLSQVAEYKETSKCGSFTTLSSSLGQILMQLHTGILYLIRHETHSGLLAGLFKMLILVISATPYARMPRELLPTVLQSLCTRIFEDHAVKKEQYTLLVNVLSCLGTAFSKTPPLFDVLKLLEEDTSQGSERSQQESNVLLVLLQCTERGMHPSIRLESLQALRAVSHNYPSTVKRTWKQVLAIINDLLQIENLGDLSYGVVSRSLKGDIEKTVGSTAEKSIVAGIKVLDACLRAASGFKGAGDLLECRLLDIQQDSDYTKKIKISSAPSYELESPEALESYTPDILSGILQWNEAIKMLLPRASSHTSPMVRAAAITCFAGMTSAVFFSLTEDKQEFILSTSVTAALNDTVPSVRSAACRAIGVIASFPQIMSKSRVLNDIIHAAEFNTHDPVVSVRITASWALANICDSLRYNFTELRKESYADELTESIIPLLAESALRLTKDGDKIKSNAVRALGNLSRFIKFDDHSSVTHLPSGSVSASHGDSHWLERMVQAFVSCVTTGNVKVQWNVCHALSNLFMNEALKLHEVSWAPAVFSILLLLLRDSTNYKIRIHAAVALAVPASRLDYGSSFSDILQGLINVLESLNSNYSSSPSSFKYKGNLEKQLMFSTLHVLGFISSTDDQALKDFLVKKASFLEEWLKLLLLSLKEEDNHPSASKASNGDKQEDGGSSLSYVPNKMMLFRAINSLLDLYKRNNHQTIAQRFENLGIGRRYEENLEGLIFHHAVACC
ncbi:HEAT repeat-containing protein 6 isoform X1 [Ananas comosus]|uniref:HEAT repeat-containing protein 6 isoform X1 n=1 Tax=Ananas comosus TaxID=4615 RepID=A0A6P5H4K9_ANACO|nr:HEAT repeat-containing protein 6 isoform X1 [Ananas comosus]